MASVSANLVPPTALPIAVTLLYTSKTFKSRIDAASASNPTGSDQTITVYLVPSGRSPDATTEVIPPLTVAAGTSIELPAMIGQIIESGGTIQALANAADAIVLTVSGLQITS